MRDDDKFRAALDRFATDEPIKAELVRLRSFAGLTLEEAAATMHIPEGTARRWWNYSRAWLYKELNKEAAR